MDMPTIDSAEQPLPEKKRRKQPGELRLAFLSRIAPKKNLDGALRLLQQDLKGRISYDIYGPLEVHDYWKKCEELIRSLTPNITVRHRGELQHDEVVKVLSEYDLFFFPTHGENFGHVIPEALIAGCPALISDQTPWRGLERAGVGWDIALDERDRFRQVLQWAIDATAEELAPWSQRARDYGLGRTYVEGAVNAHLAMIEQAMTTPRRW